MQILFKHSQTFCLAFTFLVGSGRTIASISKLTILLFSAFANDLKLSTTSGTLALALMNGERFVHCHNLSKFSTNEPATATSVPGVVVIGGMSDKFDLRVAIAVSTIGSALSILLVWGFTANLVPLLFFACLYGFFSSGYAQASGRC